MRLSAVFLTVPLFLMLAGSAPGQRQPVKPPPITPAPVDTAALERRIADLETKVAKLTKDLQTLAGNPKVADSLPQYRIYALKRLKAQELVKTLQELIPAKDAAAVRIVADPQTNSVLFRGTDEYADVVEAVIRRLESDAETPKASGKK